MTWLSVSVGLHAELLSDVARDTGLTRASARRFLLTLEQLGYVRSDDRRFTLTPRILELGYAFLSSLTLPEREPFWAGRERRVS